MPCTGAVVPGALAYRWPVVKHSSYFFLWGTETDISLMTSSTASSAADPEVAAFDGINGRAPDFGPPLAAGALSIFRRFAEGSEPWI